MADVEKPLVSIIVPVYNVEQFLDTCIESLVKQNYKQVEIILVDDGSKDNSGIMCDKWAEEDSRIKVIHKKNEGLNNARRDGFKLSQGKYILFVDSDDMIHHDTVNITVGELLNNNAEVCAFSFVKTEIITDNLAATDLNQIYEKRLLEHKKDIAEYCLLGLNKFENNYHMTVWGKLYSRKVVEQADWSASNFQSYEDNFWTSYVVMAARKVVLIPLSLYFYRQSTEHATSGISLGGKLTGNSREGTPVGYLEFVDLLFKYKNKIANKYNLKIKSELKQARTSLFLWRLNNLAAAGLISSENNKRYVAEIISLHKKLENNKSRYQELVDSLNVTDDILLRVKRKTKRTIRRPLGLARRSVVYARDNLKNSVDNLGSLVKSDTFILYRIIGNDLYPRHAIGQSRKNLEFILKHEPVFDGVTKVFIVNRIFNVKEEAAVIKLLQRYKAEYIVIPFDKNEYLKCQLDYEFMPYENYLSGDDYLNTPDDKKQFIKAAVYRRKVLYTMNSNGARNFALNNGRNRAKWVLPWDGNCYLTEDAWSQIKTSVIKNKTNKYFSVPMARLLSNNCLLEEDGEIPEAIEEPQLIFRFDTQENFNDNYPYGRREKVELLWRLGVSGKWDNWPDAFWDQPRSERASIVGKVLSVGWVARLYSGMGAMEVHTDKALVDRGSARNESIIETIRNLDMKYSGEKLHLTRQYREKIITKGNTVKHIVHGADIALKNKGYSVMNKTTVAASGDKHDYISPALYWWPNPDTADGLPYVRRDGKKAPGAVIGESGSEQFDRSTLQRVFLDSMVLGLAWLATGERKYSDKGVKIMSEFFLDSKTKMNPHLKFAQVIWGHNNNTGEGRGVIDFKDIYFYLDSIRIFEESGSLTAKQLAGFKKWLDNYLNWLVSSEQGLSEMKSKNNHGSYYDLQVVAIADFLDRKDVLYESLLRAQERLINQVDMDGRQPHEIGRTKIFHYCCFNIQAFTSMERIGRVYGFSFLAMDSHESLKKAIEWVNRVYRDGKVVDEDENFDENRIKVINYDYGCELNSQLAKVPECLSHDYGIIPYWRFGLPISSTH